MGILDRQILTVARRFRRLAWWRGLAFVFLSATVIGLLLLWLQVNGVWMHERMWFWLASATFVGCLLMSLVTYFRFRDQRWVARSIETRFPELEQRLVTSLDQIERSKGKPLGFLQHNVIEETLNHAQRHRWWSVVTPGRLLSTRLGAFVALLFVLATLAGLIRWQPARAMLSKASDVLTPKADFDIQIEPGDSEIEKGSNLIVIARFGKQVPKLAELVVNNNVGEQRYSMNRSLDDPLFGGRVPDVQTALDYRITYDGRDSKSYHVSVFTYPELVRADAWLEFPSYTETPEKRIEDTRRVSAVEGTRLTWRLHVNKSMAEARLVPDEGDDIILSPDPTDPLTYLGTIDLLQTTSWRLKLRDEDDRENRQPPKLSAKVIPNRPPNLKLELARDARVSPLEEFEVKASVSDDFGVRKYGLTYTLANNESRDITLGEAAKRREKKTAEYMLDFESLKAQPDELLAYHFWAEDDDPAGAPRRTFSDMFFAEVRHFEEIFREGQQPAGGQQQQQQQQQQGQSSENAQDAEQLAELQKQIINATWRLIRREIGSKVSDKFGDDLSIVIESQQAAIDQTEQLGQSLEDGESQAFMLEVRKQMQSSISELTDAYSEPSAKPLMPAMEAQRAAYQALLRLRAREHEVVQQQNPQSQSQSRSQSQQRFQQQLQQLELNNEQNRYETQRQAQEEQSAEETEMRQALSRLRELAQRQEDLNEQLKELQNALEQAESDEEAAEIERQLKRLRDQQQEMLRDTDELMDRLEESENQETLQETRDQLEQTRQNLQDSAESLEQGEVTPALASGTRAQRELEEMREELRRESADQFSEQMREMRDKARALESREQEIGQRFEEQVAEESDQPGLRRDKNAEEDLGDALREQNQRLNELLKEIEETVQEAEESEPLLADGLYDAFRDSEKARISSNLETAANYSDRGLRTQAQQLEQEAREGITNFREQIEQAADAVLGDQAEALRMALDTLDELQRQLDGEIGQFDPSSQRADGERQNGDSRDGSEEQSENIQGETQQQEAVPSERERNERRDERTPQDNERQPGEQGNQPGEGRPSSEQQPGEPSRSSEPSEPSEPGQPGQPGAQPGEAQPTESRNESPSDGNQPGNGPPGDNQEPQPGQEPQSGEGQPSADSQPGNQPGQPGGGRPDEAQRGPRSLRAGEPNDSREVREGRDGGGLFRGGAIDSLGSAPLTGDDFRPWSDALRDVEEIVDDPDLRAEAARIRDRAKGFREEYKRHSEEPKWDLVREVVSRPLGELRKKIEEELLRRSADRNALVPIDRDPVPDQFAEQVRRYYENLGRGN